MRKVRRRKNHMNIMVLNEEDQIEIVHVPNHLGVPKESPSERIHFPL